MKLIHTSDWHLGQNFYGYDRTDEYLYFFERMKEILRWEVPDALLVSGDIFDVSSPSAQAMRLFKDKLLELQSVVPEMQIVVTSGNHDSASRIDADRKLWASAGISVFGNVPRDANGYRFEENAVVLEGKGVIMGVPFVNKAFLPKPEDCESPERSFFRRCAETGKKLSKGEVPVVLMAHLAVEGSDLTGHREMPIGGMDAVGSAVFDGLFDYVALGHIHKQQVFNKNRVSYSGSPIAVGFDECYGHTVNSVVIGDDSKPEITRIPVPPLRELKTYPEKGVPFAKALKSLGRLDPEDISYIRLNVEQDADLPVDALEQAAAKVKDMSCRLCKIDLHRPQAERNSKDLPALSAMEFSETSPLEIMRNYLAMQGDSDESIERDMDLVAELLKEITEEETE